MEIYFSTIDHFFSPGLISLLLLFFSSPCNYSEDIQSLMLPSSLAYFLWLSARRYLIFTSFRFHSFLSPAQRSVPSKILLHTYMSLAVVVYDIPGWDENVPSFAGPIQLLLRLRRIPMLLIVSFSHNRTLPVHDKLQIPCSRSYI